MKHSSPFWKCWYKAFWHFLKPFSFMCACVYEDYLKDETWPYKFILVDKTIQVEVCIKMYFSLAKNTSPSCKEPRGIAAGFNQLLWAMWSRATLCCRPQILIIWNNHSPASSKSIFYTMMQHKANNKTEIKIYCRDSLLEWIPFGTSSIPVGRNNSS